MPIMPDPVVAPIPLVRHDRRVFLGRAAALGGALSLLAACEEKHDADRPERDHGEQEGSRQRYAAPPLVPTTPWAVRDAALPPATRERVRQLRFEARDVNFAISPNEVVPVWTFEGQLPGPLVHVRQGDTIEFTLVNHGSMPHSMDFHAAQIDPVTAFRSVPPGQSVSYTYRPRHGGAFLYHCGTDPVLMHMGMGMFGAIVVDPATPLPPAREFVLIQNEFYIGGSTSGALYLDYTKMLATLPDVVVFNGHPMQYMSAPLRVKRGERVRFHVVNAGPSLGCAFHVVGEQFDVVYLAAPPSGALHGVQTFNVPPGGGMIFEMMADIPGTFTFVNHAFGHGQKGAIGHLVVEP